MKHLVFAFAVLVLALVISPRLWYHHLRQLPLYDKSQPLHRLVNVWSPKDLESLRDFVRNGTFRTMPRNTANREREVRLPPSADGECPYEYLVKVEDACVPIGRLDSLLHLARFGGVEGYKESVKDLMNTVHVFQMFQFGQELQRPEIKSFMSSEAFENAAKEVCGSDFPYRKEVQVNMNILLPGQQLPMHFDVPYFFEGGIVQHFPLWLLAVMQGSGFWDDDIPPHVQGQAYLHFNESLSGGQYFAYPDGPGGARLTIEPKPNSAILVDGSRVMHGVQRIRPGSKAPPLFHEPGEVKYQASSHRWEVRKVNGDLVQSYRDEDLRVTFIWRSLCFKTKADRDNWNPNVPMYQVDQVLKVLEDDLRRRSILGPTDPVPDMFDFALMLIDEYIRYPIGNEDAAWIPFNYCLIPHLATNQSLRRLLNALVTFFAC